MSECDSKESKVSREQPNARLASSYCYNQTYAVLKSTNSDSKFVDDESREVFFRCGNWCYLGTIQFNNLKICTSDLPIVIPLLQRQQGSLRYYCNANGYVCNIII